MRSNMIDRVRRRMGFDNGFNVDPVSVAGGLSLWWDNNVEMEVLFSTPNLIEVESMMSYLRSLQENWEENRDANTTFFHQSTLQHRRNNNISKIKNDDRVWIVNEEGIRQTVEAHFKNLFTTSQHRDWGNVLDCVSHIVSGEMNDGLTGPILEVKVKEAVFQMGGMKAPGPNEFQGMFYQTYWETILAEVQGTMKYFF
ncbi:hypothetical protein L3X38_041613 [Prunus dulcis]|uniref:RNA-directed DNA polymerase (Reverse transcriptase) n=1 Tax=Prunus dulcis TaxID=3755 RepID=A0AAD4UTA3_PRUDU|nr:hypothetical protein L3X38_041613 [Prunus dulcis]